MNDVDRTKLKICGMRDHQNIMDVSHLRPDYMGFIFFEKSPRFVGNDFVMPLIDGRIRKVGVVVNMEIAAMIDIFKKHKLDLLQLHGDESAAQCEELRERGIKVIKAFRIDEKFDFDVLTPFVQVVDYFLFDTKGPLYGGNATTFDWNILRRYSQRIPFFLSGGLNAGNVSQLPRLDGMNVHALDLNSGVEVAPGLKDVEKIQKVKTVLTDAL